MIKDDHPIRTIFIETVANRCSINEIVARKFIAPISTDRIDYDWPIEEVVAQFEKGDLVAVL